MEKWNERCPDCEGLGVVQSGFYHVTPDGMAWISGVQYTCCNKCGGSGVVEMTRAPSGIMTIDVGAGNG